MLSAYAANAACMTVLAMQYNLTLLDLWICWLCWLAFLDTYWKLSLLSLLDA